MLLAVRQDESHHGGSKIQKDKDISALITFNIMANSLRLHYFYQNQLIEKPWSKTDIFSRLKRSVVDS